MTGKFYDKAWLVLFEGEYRVAYLDRLDEKAAEASLIWWDHNHDCEICEEGQEEAAAQISLPSGRFNAAP